MGSSRSPTHTASTCSTNEGFPAEKVFVIPNGVDTNRFAPTLEEPSVRAEIGVGPTDPVVSIVAALRPEKNHELFLEVARRALAQFPNAKFLIIGEGPRREPLEQHAADMGITASVRFLGNRSDIAAPAHGERRVSAHFAQRSEPRFDS